MIANIVGSIWLAVISFIFVPVYIKYLGVAAWGLIGIFSTLQVVFSLLDMGLSSTLNREMARLSQMANSSQTMRNLLRTLEWVYWCMAAVVALTVLLLAPLLTRYWITSTALSQNVILESLFLMGIVIALQLPVGLYSGGFLGLQKQVLLSTINVVVGTFRSIGAVIVLWLVSPSIHAFFLWQIVTSILNVFLLIFFIWRSLPPAQEKAIFNVKLLQGIWKFAIGMSGISILGIILSQLDKIVLSKLMSLDEFGYYMLGSAVAMTIGRLILPLFYSFYPKFTQLATANDLEELKRLYHRVSQLVSVFILPIAGVLAFFSYDILLLWTNNALLAEKSHFIVSVLVCGSAVNAIMHPPYALQLAFGWTKLSLFKNVVAIIMIVPLMILLANYYGAIGAAFAWLVLNIGYLIFEISIMHLRLLSTEKFKWYIQDISLPLFSGLAVTGLARLFFVSHAQSHFVTLIYVSGVYLTTLAFAAVATPITRGIIFTQLARMNLIVYKGVGQNKK